MKDPLENTDAGALDALLKSNKEQFERKFANQMRDADAAGLRQDAGAAGPVPTTAHAGVSSARLAPVIPSSPGSMLC